jgi:peptidoglycan/xylan/chitin deacetylase (PgdA/CDA1 family)
MKLYPHRIWRMPDDGGTVYLTFDDGPTPGVTDQLLVLLDRFDAKATFFVVGDRVNRHPDLTRRILSEGHVLGNHTHRHLNGWKTATREYLQDVREAQDAFSRIIGYQPGLFRPPYGKAGLRSARQLAHQFKLVMWDVMPGDFYPDHDAKKVQKIVLRDSRPGSVIVLHDSPKYGAKMLEAMPGILEHFQKMGYRMAALPDPALTRQTQT